MPDVLYAIHDPVVGQRQRSQRSHHGSVNFTALPSKLTRIRKIFFRSLWNRSAASLSAHRSEPQRHVAPARNRRDRLAQADGVDLLAR
jgi:hypothetical protein